MKQIIVFLISFIAISKTSFAQDTTGGTRPTIVIPLKKVTPAMQVVPPSNGQAYTLDTMAGPAPVNSDERRIQRAAAKQKQAKAKAKKITRP